MICRTDGTVIPQTASECEHMLCRTELPNDWRINGQYLINSGVEYVHHSGLDCAFAHLCPSHMYTDYTGAEGINEHECECAVRDVLITSHLNSGGTLAELGI